MRILVVEDHAETCSVLEGVLRRAGHEVWSAASLGGARARLSEGRFGALVLDWMLPDGAGTDLCRELRDRGDQTPVLMLTARGDVGDRVEGLDAGADDYLRKPFAVAELLARLRSLARRGPRPVDASVRLGPLEVKLDARRIVRGAEDIPVTAREFAILEVLLLRRGRVVPRSDILVAAWGDESPEAAASMEVLLARLRRKLAAAGFPDAIRTHRGLGYSLRERA